MNVITVEHRIHGRLRGRRFWVTVSWTPTRPYEIALIAPHGEQWRLSREALALALGGQRMDRATFDAARIEIVLADEDGDDQVEITRYFTNLQPIPVWFDAADWQHLLDNTTAVIPLGTEHAYIDWPAEFPDIYTESRKARR